MDKKYLSFFVILCTMLSVSIMLSFNKSESINSGKAYENSSINTLSTDYKDDKKDLLMEKFYIRFNHLNRTEDKTNENSATSIKNDNNSNLKTQKDSSEKVALKDNGTTSKGDNSDNKAISSNTDMVGESIEDDAYQNDVPSNEDATTSVFKVQKEMITSEITPSEKSKLLSVAKKLSPFDYIKIYNFINSPDSEQGIKNAMLMLKSRLSYADYDEVKEVAKRFLNLGVIEK